MLPPTLRGPSRDLRVLKTISSTLILLLISIFASKIHVAAADQLRTRAVPIVDQVGVVADKIPDGFALRGGPLLVEDLEPHEVSAWDSTVKSRQLSLSGGGLSKARALSESGGGEQCILAITFPPPDDGWAFVSGIPEAAFTAGDGDFSSDGGLFVVGQQAGTISAGPYFVVLYFDSAFNLVWGRRIPAGGVVAEGVLIRTGSVVIGNTVTLTGFTNYDTQSGGDIFIAQLDVTGAMLWSTVFGSAGLDYGLTVTQTLDGGFAVGALSQLFSANHDGGCVAKLDSSGTLQWVTSVDGFGIPIVSQLPNGSVLISTTALINEAANAPSSDTSAWTLLIAIVNGTTGSLLSANSYSIFLHNSVFDVHGFATTPTAVVSPNGDLLAVACNLINSGDFNAGVGLSLVNLTTGNVSWTHLLPSTGYDQFYDVLWAPDGSLLYLGTTSSFGVGGSKDILLMRVQTNGTITYTVAIGGSLIDVGYSLRTDSAGGVYLIGYSSSFGVGVTNPVIVYLDEFTTAPRQVGVLTITDITKLWIPSSVTMNLTAVNATLISHAENLAGPNLVTSPPFSGSDIGNILGFVNTWLTYPLLSKSFPFATAALLEFPWLYTLPSTVYQHLSNTTLSLTISSDASFLSVVPNSLSISGTPILASASTYTVNMTITATIPYIGFTVFPTISLTLCVEATTPYSFGLITLEYYAEFAAFEFTTFLAASNGNYIWIGAAIYFKDGSSTGFMWAYSDIDRSEILWALCPITEILLPIAEFQCSLQSIVEDSEGNYVVAGYTTEFAVGGSSDFILTKTTADGALVWSSTLGGSGWDEATGIVYTPDGYMIVGGFTDSFGVGGYDALVVSIDASGSPIWNFTYGSIGDEQLLSLVVLPSGSLLGVGYSTDSLGAGGQDCFLLQFTSTGSITSARLFGSTGDDVINAVAVTGSGGIMFTGSSSSGSAGGSDVLVGSVSLSPEGDSVTFASTYGGSAADVGSGICLDGNGGIAVTGYTSSVGAGGKDILMSVYDSDGSLVWSTATGGPADDTGIRIVQNGSTSYLDVLATANSFGYYPAGWLRTSPTGDLSPNFPGDTIPSGLTYTGWGNTPVVNATDMKASVMSGATVFPFSDSFGLGVAPRTSTFDSTLQYFIVSQLPPTLTQVPFAKPFNMSLYECIASGTTFQTVSLVGSQALPGWLTFNQVIGVLSGIPTGSVRGLYYLQLTVVVLNQQSISFALNVTNTAPFYDGPTVLSTGLGNFVFSLRDYVFDAEGDTVGNYQLAPYFPPGSNISIEPNPIATVNSFTGQLQGAPFSGSGGAYIYNLTMSDSFGAVGWKVIVLLVHEPSAVAALIEKLLPELSAATLLLFVLFALWRRDQTVNNSAQWLQKLAVLYCRPHQQPPGHNLAMELVEARRSLFDTLSTTLDRADFDPIAARSTVEQYSNRLVMLAMRDQSDIISDEVTGSVGAQKLINKLARIAKRRLAMGPPEKIIKKHRTESKVAFHMKTLFLLNSMNHILEAMLLCFGAQLTTVTLKQRVTFLGSLLNVFKAPFRFCFSSCSRQNFAADDVVFAVPHSIRQMMVNDATMIQGWTTGSRLGDLTTLCCSRRETTTLLELQLRHAAARLYQSILYLPDSASGLDLLLDSLTRVLDPGSLLKDLTALIQMPQDWYTLYMSTRLSLQALMDTPDRTARLADVQRALYARCFQSRACGRGYDVSWKLLFGCVNLFTELLIAEPSPLNEVDRMQLRGDAPVGGSGTTDGPPMLTLRLLAQLPYARMIWKEETNLIRRAAVESLDLTGSGSLIDPANTNLCLWTLRPSPHVRIQHSAFLKFSGSTLLPVLKEAQFGSHTHRVGAEEASPAPYTILPFTVKAGALRSQRISEEEDEYILTGLETVPLEEPVSPRAIIA